VAEDATSDIAKATEVAIAMVTRLGMTPNLPPIKVDYVFSNPSFFAKKDDPQRHWRVSERLAGRIDENIIFLNILCSLETWIE
jgi:ATP-dependent Zn protease